MDIYRKSPAAFGSGARHAKARRGGISSIVPFGAVEDVVLEAQRAPVVASSNRNYSLPNRTYLP